MSRPNSDRAVEAALAGLEIETPSWGYGDSGTRFAVFQQAARPRDVFERLDDAARGPPAHRRCPGRGAALPLGPGRRPTARCARTPSRVGLRIGAVNPNLFQDADYMLGSIAHPAEAVRAKAVDHLLECVRDRAASSARRRSRCGSPTAPTTPARTTCARAAGACSKSLGRSTRRCPPAGAADRVQVLRARLLRDRPRRLGHRRC